MAHFHRLVIVRGKVAEDGVFGQATLTAVGNDLVGQPISRDWRYVSMEPPHCIPVGVYYAYTHRSPNLGNDPRAFELQRLGIYELQNVPRFPIVEIIPATFAGDVAIGLHSDMRGMIAIGYNVKARRAPNSRNRRLQRTLVDSAIAHHDFTMQTGGAGLRVEIKGGPRGL